MNTLTDIALCKLVDSKIENYYLCAQRFGCSIPDYALIQYRKAAECICDVLIEYFKQPFSDKNSLWKKINFLSEHDYIGEELKQQLDAIRENANNGAHHVKDDEGKFDNKALISQRLHHTRECLISSLMLSYSLMTGKQIAEVRLSQVSVQKNREIIIEAMTSTDWNAHYRAGLCYEELIADDIIVQGKLLDNKEKTLELLMSYYRAAANCYETAFKLSSDSRFLFSDYSSSSEEQNDLLLDCELEPLFKYCQVLLSSGTLAGEFSRALKLLEFAANKGHGGSCGLLGNYLYDQGRYQESLTFLLLAASLLDDDGLCGLFFYYSEGKAVKPDYEKAQYYLQQGLDQGSVQCLGVLGGAYFNGTCVEKNPEKGLDLARQAMQKGSLQAYHFVKEAEMSVVSDFYLSTQPHFDADTLKSVGRNDPCPCGSGKKFKKCCLAY